MLLTAIPMRPMSPSITKKLITLPVSRSPPNTPKNENGMARNTSSHWISDRNWMINSTSIEIRANPNAKGREAKDSWLSDSRPKSKPSASASRPSSANSSAP